MCALCSLCILCALPLVPSAGGRRGWPAEGPLRLGLDVLAGHRALAPIWLGLGLGFGGRSLAVKIQPDPNLHQAVGLSFHTDTEFFKELHSA